MTTLGTRSLAVPRMCRKDIGSMSISINLGEHVEIASAIYTATTSTLPARLQSPCISLQSYQSCLLSVRPPHLSSTTNELLLFEPLHVKIHLHCTVAAKVSALVQQVYAPARKVPRLERMNVSVPVMKGNRLASAVTSQ